MGLITRNWMVLKMSNVCEHGTLRRKCYICYLEEEVERLEKAISVCIDRMKEGGPGTRSFVYETLKKALEGEE